MEFKPLKLKCPNCGAPIKLSPKLSLYKCDYCKGEFYLSIDLGTKIEEIDKNKIISL